MPIDTTLPGFFADEYDRFVRGLEGLSPDEQAAVRAALARTRPFNPQPRVIAVPGLDDVFHVIPPPTITPEMRDLHYYATQRGQPSPLAPELQAEIERRAAIARRIRQSPTPSYARAYGQIMTAVDNVQDLLSSVATLGRLVINPLARALDQIGTTPTQTAVRIAAERQAFLDAVARRAAGELITPLALAELQGQARAQASRALVRGALGLGARTLGRLLPIVGWVLLASDLLNLVNLLGLLLFPFWAAYCGGPPAILGAGAPAFLAKRALKTRVFGIADANPFSRTARAKRSRNLRRWKPSLGNLIEVAQTTDAIAGYGMSFGALVGLVTDSAFGLEQRMRGLDVRVTAEPFARSVHQILAPTIRPVPTPALHDYRGAGATLGNAPAVNRRNPEFSADEHLDFYAAQLAAWQFLQPIIATDAMETAVNAALDYSWPPPEHGADNARALLQAEGIDPGPIHYWPLPGAPTRITGADLLSTTPAEITATLGELIAPRRNDMTGVVLAALVSKITEHAMVALTGAADAWDVTYSSPYQTLADLVEEGIYPRPDPTGDRLLDLVTAAERRREDTGRRHLQRTELVELARVAGVELIPLLTPDFGGSAEPDARGARL